MNAFERMYPRETGFAAGAGQELPRNTRGFLGVQERGLLGGMYAGISNALSAPESICEESRDGQREKTGIDYIRGISDNFNVHGKVCLMVSVRISEHMCASVAKDPAVPSILLVSTAR